MASAEVTEEVTGNACSEALIAHISDSSVRFRELEELRSIPADEQMRLVVLRTLIVRYRSFNFSDFNANTFAPNIARLAKFTTFDRHLIFQVLAGTGSAWHRYLDANPNSKAMRAHPLALNDLPKDFQSRVRAELIGMVGNYESRMFNVLRIRRMLEELNGGRSVIASGELHVALMKLIDHVFGSTPNAEPLKTYLRILSLGHKDGENLPFDPEAQHRLFQVLNKLAQAADIQIRAENNLANERLLLEALIALGDTGL